MISEVFNVDCMEYMRTLPDKFFDLAVVDPVFGEQVIQGGYMKNNSSKLAKNKKYNNALWRQPKTNQLYFNELKRISDNQIIWGGNYFIQEISQNTSCFIVWDKENGDNHFADCELAWASFDTAVRKFTYKWQGMLQADMKNKEQRIHPTQKPVALYKWLLQNYAKPNDKIFDSHMGSQSSRIACHDLGFDFWGCELDADYFKQGNERYETHIKQQSLFTPQEQYLSLKQSSIL